MPLRMKGGEPFDQKMVFQSDDDDDDNKKGNGGDDNCTNSLRLYEAQTHEVLVFIYLSTGA